MSEFCEYCGTKLYGFIDCPNCGAKSAGGTNAEPTSGGVLIETESPTMESEDASVNYTDQSENNVPLYKNMGCMIPISIFIGFFVIMGIIGAISSSLENRIINGASIPAEKAKAVIAALNECGISDISSIKYDASLDNKNEAGEKGYKIALKDMDGTVLFLNKDGKVNLLAFEDNDLYVKGKVISNISEYMFTSAEKSALRNWCERGILNLLKNPSTQFPTEDIWKFSRNKQRIVVSSFFDYKNASGKTARSTFEIIFTADKNNLTSFKVDNKEYK